jgi:membrane-bound ClpP family serine protease
MKKQLTLQRFVVAVITMAAEQFAIWAILRLLLPHFNIFVPLWVPVVIMSLWFVMGIIIFVSGTGALDKKNVIGLSSMVGIEGEVVDRLAPEGTVKLHDELWSAVAAEGTVERGEKVTVIGEDGLILKVKKLNH